jgi:hypothetical protein
MAVHSSTFSALETDMTSGTPTEPLPFAAGDPEWVADLVETVRAGDLDVVAAGLDELVAVVRRAVKARTILAGVNPDLLRAGLKASASRGTES